MAFPSYINVDLNIVFENGIIEVLQQHFELALLFTELLSIETFLSSK